MRIGKPQNCDLLQIVGQTFKSNLVIDIIYGTDQYGQSSGTSFSAPYVSGIIANMLEIDPKLCLSDIIDIISMTAEDLGRQGYDEMFGYGLVRADRIAEYMLKGMKIYTSGFDLCPEDDCYEVRLWVNEKTKRIR